MIDDKDRIGYFGASDISYIMAKNLDTASFGKWWMTKLGLYHNDFETLSMNAGTNKEHQILDSLNVPGMVHDRQIIIEDLLLRVNLDGDNGKKIYECKTFKAEKGFNCSLQYRRQVNVQMFASGIGEAEIVAYGLCEEDFENYCLPIDRERLLEIPISYDDAFISSFLCRIEWFAKCLKEGRMPR